MSTTKRNTPLTSILAHESVKPDKEAIYQKLITGLNKLKKGGISEEVAKAAQVTYAQAHKRLPELRDKKNLVYNDGTMKKGASGRECMIWLLNAADLQK